MIASAKNNDRFRTIGLHSVGDVLREHARSRPAMTAIVDGSVRLTWPQLNQRVNRLCNTLGAAGVGEGDRILWLGQNSFRLLECLLAAAKIGAMVCPANWRLSAAELAFVVDDFAPRLVIWQQAEIGETIIKARHLSTHDCLWVKHDSVSGDGHGICYEHWIAGASDADEQLRFSGDMPLIAIYTAAFDGHPNAAQLGNATVISQSLLIAYAESITEKSTFLNSGPLFHLGTLLSTLAVFLFGGKNVFIARVEAESMLQLIAGEGVTHAFIAQPTIDQIRKINADGRYDTSSLWSAPDAPEWRNPLVMPAGAPLNSKPFLYGQTELMGFAVMGWLGGQGAGRPSPLVQIKILAPDGSEVPTGDIGEIAARGTLVMQGYYNRAAENDRRSQDDWYRTHDLGRRLADGSIEFVGPKTTMIKSGVENIYPAELEACIRTMAAVQDVCVIGVPDPVWTQNVKALVVVKPGFSLTLADLTEHCLLHLASYKKPKMLELVEALPRRADFSLDRQLIDEKFGGGGYPCSL